MMNDVTPDYRGLFPTPAYVVDLPDSQGLNAELTRIILARETAESGLSNSNVGGWHSGRDLAQWGGPALQTLLEVGKTVANQLTRNRRGEPQQIVWEVECWANVNRRGHANKRHSHPGCFWSGTYYVATGEAGEDKGGRFEFLDPRGAAAALPLAAGYHLPNKAPGTATGTVTPRNGRLLLFPSWMPHAVESYQGAGERISIAFNFARPRGAS